MEEDMFLGNRNIVLFSTGKNSNTDELTESRPAASSDSFNVVPVVNLVFILVTVAIVTFSF